MIYTDVPFYHEDHNESSEFCVITINPEVQTVLKILLLNPVFNRSHTIKIFLQPTILNVSQNMCRS